LPDLPKPEEGLTQLLIVPDGELWNLPFELLLTEKTDNSFLIKQLAIRYLWTLSDALPKDSRCKGKDLSFFTTNYKNQPNNKYAALQPAYKTAKEWAKGLSVNHYRRYIHGDFQHNIHASESEFSGTNIAAFAALHLALYSEGDSENPMNSRIFMSFLPDSVSDGLLHAYELAQYQMPLSLLSIASLQDSFGFNDANAALMLAFAEVGVESVIWPQWATSDEYTRKLMLQFYKNLATGMSKASALQQAKIALMEDKNSPYFWASHRLLGQDGLVSLRTRFRFPWLWVGGGAGVLGLLALLWFLRRRKAQAE
jgi:CHAT domain-containing protein